MKQEELPFEAAFRGWVRDRGMSWEQLRLPLGGTEGETTAFRLSPAAPPRRIVVALHGAGNDALFGWVGLFKALLLERSEILTFDLPGHGRFNRSRFGAEEAVNCVTSVLELCTMRNPGVVVHAVGVSLGGSILLGALARASSPVSSAAAIVAPLRIVLSARTVIGELGLRSLRTVMREREHYGWTGLVPSFGSFKREIYPLRLPPPPPEGTFGYVDALNENLAAMRLEQHAPDVSTPVLLVYGDRDRIVPLEQGERLAGLLPRATLLRIGGGTHLSTPLEPETIRRVAEWLTGDGDTGD